MKCYLEKYKKEEGNERDQEGSREQNARMKLRGVWKEEDSTGNK